ncbi:MAG: VOC family protein [Planctomycetota bacterium]
MKPHHAFSLLIFASLAVYAITPAREAACADPVAGAPISARVERIGLTVADLENSLSFYTQVLGFEPVGEIREVWGAAYEQLHGVFGLRMRIARLKLGDEHIELFEYLAPKGRPVPPDTRSNDLWFQHLAIIVSDMPAAYTRLRAHRVTHASTGPQILPAWNPAAGGIEAFYFRDPDGHHLELLRFPKGKGHAKWQRQDALFLGIDHTAIVVSDTEASLAHYRDRLGLRVVGTSENYGTEQEHLNNVYGARLRITALRAATGPGIELLEYLAPRDGRRLPIDSRPNDLTHWQITIVTNGPVERAITALSDGRGPARYRVTELGPDAAGGFTRSFLATDPDGHVTQWIQEEGVDLNGALETDKR